MVKLVTPYLSVWLYVWNLACLYNARVEVSSVSQIGLKALDCVWPLYNIGKRQPRLEYVENTVCNGRGERLLYDRWRGD